MPVMGMSCAGCGVLSPELLRMKTYLCTSIQRMDAVAKSSVCCLEHFSQPLALGEAPVEVV
jgi:hypothetical protein